MFLLVMSYAEHLATILLALLRRLTAMLNNCYDTYSVICVLQYHSRRLYSTVLNTQSQSHNLNLLISHPQKDEFSYQMFPCIYKITYRIPTTIIKTYQKCQCLPELL